MGSDGFIDMYTHTYIWQTSTNYAFCANDLILLVLPLLWCDILSTDESKAIFNQLYWSIIY